MSSTVINVFEKGVAEKVVRELEKDGFGRQDINVVTKSADTKNLIGKLTNESVPKEDAQYYVEAVSAGQTLLYVKADDQKAERAVAIMERYNAAQSTPTGKGEGKGRAGRDGEVALPVIEEQLQVGKRQVERGGVRVHSRVTERPVEETVSLREETVHVDRRPADREVTQADMTAVREGAIELTETDEEAVVSKQARVVEEVVIGKDVQQRQETISDTVRRTDVEVEQIDADPTKARGKSNRS